MVTGGFALLAASGLAGGGLSTMIIPLVGAGTLGLVGAGQCSPLSLVEECRGSALIGRELLAGSLWHKGYVASMH